MINLWDDQQELVTDARAKIGQGFKSMLIQAETGSGKTVIGSYMIKQANHRPNTPNTCLLYTSPSPRDS